MKKSFYLFAALVTLCLAAACKKNNPDCPDGKQWIITYSDHLEFFDFGVGNGKCYWTFYGLDDVIFPANETYLIPEKWLSDYSITDAGDGDWKLVINSSNDVYTCILNPRKETFRWDGEKVIYLLKPSPRKFKLLSSNLPLVKLKGGYTSYDCITTEKGLEALGALCSMTSTWAAETSLRKDGKEGAVADYQGKEVTMKYVFVRHIDNLVSVAEKARIAAERGAVCLVLCIYDYPTKKLMDAIPADSPIPVLVCMDNAFNTETSITVTK